MTDNEVTMSGKRSIPLWLEDHDKDIIDLKKACSENETADDLLEKRVTVIETRHKFMVKAASVFWSVVLIVLGWIASKL